MLLKEHSYVALFNHVVYAAMLNHVVYAAMLHVVQGLSLGISKTPCNGVRISTAQAP